jgi:hypothetical protein
MKAETTITVDSVPAKGRRTRDELSKPICSTNGRLRFLELFCKWLREWGEQQTSKGCLSQQTQRALLHTSDTLPHLVNYVLTDLGMDYILLGKVPTDNLERRFRDTDNYLAGIITCLSSRY